MKILLGVCLITCCLLSGCQLDEEIREEARQQGLTGDVAQHRQLPAIDDPLPQLGLKLFYTKALSGDKDVACVSCHHPVLGGGDGLSLSIGTGAIEDDVLGPERQHSSLAANYNGGGPTVPRNAPTVFNIAFYDQTLFDDGRIECVNASTGANGEGDDIRTPDVAIGMIDPDAGDNLTMAQARFPITSKAEMRGFTFLPDASNDEIRAHLANRLAGAPGYENELDKNQWLTWFRAGFSDPEGTAQALITEKNIARALGEFERSMVFVDTPWKAYLAGNDDAISLKAKMGALLFMRPVRKGGAGCMACHKGDFFTDESFHVLAVPQVGIGKDHDSGIDGTNDRGRWYQTRQVDDRFAFRTPTLLNVTETGPWGHSGAYTTLQGIIRHHLNPRKAVYNYDVSQLDPRVQTEDMLENTEQALQQLSRLQREGKSKLVATYLSDSQIDLLIAFLASLTDPCVKRSECLSPWIDTGESPDDLQLIALDGQGHPLE